MRPAKQILLGACCLVMVVVTQGNAQQESELSPRTIRQTLTRQAADYKITAPESKTKLTLQPKSLLNWNNPQRTTEVGVVQVWTDAGLPMVIASLFTYEYQGTKLKHELISLASEPLSASYGNQLAWTPKVAGIRWSKLPDAWRGPRTVGNSKVRRLIQMRRLAAAFEFEVTARTGEVSKLRLMTQPIYRFESNKHNIVDGAIFAYSIATDPEVLLLLKAGDEPTWDYALVRSTNLGLIGEVSEEQIWVQRAIPELDNSMLGQAPFSSYPYTSFHPTNDRLFESMPQRRINPN